MLLIQGRVKIAVLSAVFAILFHHNSMDIWTDSNVVSTGKRGSGGSCLQLLQYCYIAVIWIHGLNVMLLVQGSEEMAVLPAVTAVLLHRCAMGTWTDCNVVSTV